MCPGEGLGFPVEEDQSVEVEGSGCRRQPRADLGGVEVRPRRVGGRTEPPRRSVRYHRPTDRCCSRLIRRRRTRVNPSEARKRIKDVRGYPPASPGRAEPRHYCSDGTRDHTSRMSLLTDDKWRRISTWDETGRRDRRTSETHRTSRVLRSWCMGLRPVSFSVEGGRPRTHLESRRNPKSSTGPRPGDEQ